MKFVVPKNKRQKRKTVRFLRIIFPALGAVAAWKFFYKRKKYTRFFNVQKKKNTLGFVGISTLAFLGVRVLYLRYLAVERQKQGQGAGTEILKELERKAKKEKHDFIFLTSSKHRKKTHRFYLKNGFHRIFGEIFWKKLK